nr:LD-carboxypeptidase [Desulfobulbaceae bacterium]
MTAFKAVKQKIKPPVLKKGDRVGIAAPAGPIDRGMLLNGLNMLKELGLEVSYADDIGNHENYLAGSDERRLKEFHQLWADPEVKAIIAARGGFGCSRLIEHLDYDLIAGNPKILIGFSDLTIMLNTIFEKTGLITFHGPMLSTMVRDGNGREIFNQLAGPSQEEIKARPLEILRDGNAQGNLLGGNLTCLQNLTGTQFMPDGQDALLFIEDVNEPAYKIDRILTHLKMIGVLDKFSGIILGQFLNSDLQQQDDCELIWGRVLELTDTIPVWSGFPVGHGKKNLLLPVGGAAQMDSNSGVLRFLEASRTE